MPRLGLRDLRQVLEALRALYSLRTLDAFPTEVLGILAAVVPGDFSSYNQVDLRQRRIAWIVEPPDALVPNLEPIFARHIDEHPFLAHYARCGDGRPRKISDFLTRSHFHRLALYNEVYRRTGVEHQIAIAWPPGRGVVAIGIDRGRQAPDFTERDRLALDLLRPHLIQAYRNAEAFSASQRDLAMLGKAVGELQRGLILVPHHGRPVFANERAAHLLDRYFDRLPRRRTALPEPLSRWVRYEEALLEVHDDIPRPRAPFVVTRHGRRLVVRLLTEPGLSALVLVEEWAGTAVDTLRRLGLTPREAEVLAWVTRGKRNAEVASILKASPSTVSKHLERIYQKLGVETRTAAVARAFEAIGEQAGDHAAWPPAAGELKTPA